MMVGLPTRTLYGVSADFGVGTLLVVLVAAVLLTLAIYIVIRRANRTRGDREAPE